MPTHPDRKVSNISLSKVKPGKGSISRAVSKVTFKEGGTGSAITSFLILESSASDFVLLEDDTSRILLED